MASGATQAPVAPRSLAWEMTSRNSVDAGGGELARGGGSRRTTTPWWVLSVCGTTNGCVGVLGGHGAVAPGVAAGEGDPSLGEPLASAMPGPGLTGE